MFTFLNFTRGIFSFEITFFFNLMSGHGLISLKIQKKNKTIKVDKISNLLSHNSPKAFFQFVQKFFQTWYLFLEFFSIHETTHRSCSNHFSKNIDCIWFVKFYSSLRICSDTVWSCHRNECDSSLHTSKSFHLHREKPRLIEIATLFV